MRFFPVLLISLAFLPLSTAVKCYTKGPKDKTQIEETCPGRMDYCRTHSYYDTDGLRFFKLCSELDDCPLKKGDTYLTPGRATGCETLNNYQLNSVGERVDLTKCCCKGDLCNKDDHLAATPTSDRYLPTVIPSAIKCYTKGWDDKTQIEETCGYGDYCRTSAYYDIDGLRFSKRCTKLEDCPVKEGGKETTGCNYFLHKLNSVGERVHLTKCCCKGDLCNKDNHLDTVPTPKRYPPTVIPSAIKCYTKGWEDKPQIEKTCGNGEDYCMTSAFYDIDGIRFYKRCTELKGCRVKNGCKTYKKHTINSIGKEVDMTHCCCKGDLCNEDDHKAATPTSDRSL